MISIRNVSKSFGSQVVLDRVNLEIQAGKTTAIVGPSGVGKSVLLKLIMGILDPDSGEIFIDGVSITRAKRESEKNRIRASLGVLFQSAALFDSLSVFENVRFPLVERRKELNLSYEEIDARTWEILDSLGLEKNAFNHPEELSMGMRKRVGMARALITEPKVLLFDEPNTGLDPLVGKEVYDLINESKRDWGFTGVVISHELPEVFVVADRIAMILHGRFIIEGSPEDFRSSSDPAVQQFLHGRTNGPIKIQ